MSNVAEYGDHFLVKLYERILQNDAYAHLVEWLDGRFLRIIDEHGFMSVASLEGVCCSTKNDYTAFSKQLRTYRFMRTNAARALSNDNLGKFIYEHEVFRADTPIEELSKVSPLPTQKSPRRTAGKQRTDSKRAPRRPRTSKPAAKRSRKPAKKKKAISRTILPRRRSSDTSTVSSGTSTGSSTGSVTGNASCGSLASLVSCTSNSCASSIFGSDREQNFGDNLHREDICGDTDDDDEDDTSISFAGTRSLREMLEPRPSSANTTPPSGGSSLPTQDDRSGSRSMSDSIHPDHTVTSPEAPDETEDAFSEIFAASAGLEDRRSSEQFAPEISMPTEWPGDHGPHPTAGDDTFTATIEQEVKTPCGRDAMLGSICASANTITAEENQTISELSHLAVESLMDTVDEQAENASQEVIEYIDSCDNAISVPIDKIWATPEAFQVWVEGSLSLKGSLLSQPRRRKMFIMLVAEKCRKLLPSRYRSRIPDSAGEDLAAWRYLQRQHEWHYDE